MPSTSVRRSLNSRHWRAPIDFCQSSQRRYSSRAKVTFGETPRPIAFARGGSIHARTRVQTKHILQRNYRRCGHRGEHGSDEVPMDRLAVTIEVFHAAGALAL